MTLAKKGARHLFSSGRSRKKVPGTISRLAVFASGFGSNLQAIINACPPASSRGRWAAQRKRIPVEVALVISDRAEAYALKRARRARIPALAILPNHFPSKKAFEAEITRQLTAHRITLIALAGFMRILSKPFVRRYRHRILNIHPALLPAFKGAHAIRDAHTCGVKVTGVTVHFVTEDVDAGPIILQEAVQVDERDTQKTLEAKIHRVEHQLYPEAIRLVATGRTRLVGRRVQMDRHSA